MDFNNEENPRKPQWQPEGSWIMLDDSQQNLIDKLQDIHNASKTEQEETEALNEIANEMDNIALEGSDMHQDACNSMEEAELSLGLSLRLGVNADELDKTNRVVQSVSNQEFKPLDVILQENQASTSYRGQSSPSSVSSSNSSVDDNLEESCYTTVSCARSFSPPAQDLKYGGRAPPVPGALAPPARSFGLNVENTEEVNTNPEFSWVQASCKLEQSIQENTISKSSSTILDRNEQISDDEHTQQLDESMIASEISSGKESSSIVVVENPESNTSQSSPTGMHSMKKTKNC